MTLQVFVKGCKYHVIQKPIKKKSVIYNPQNYLLAFRSISNYTYSSYVSSVCMLLFCPNKWLHVTLSLKLFSPLTYRERRERRRGCLEGWTDAKTQSEGCPTVFFLPRRLYLNLYDTPFISEMSSWWNAWRFQHIHVLTKCLIVYTQISSRSVWILWYP